MTQDFQDQEHKIAAQKNLSNDELLERTHTLVKEERRIGIEVIQHLQEIFHRKLYLKVGYPSLFQMCIEEFKYSAPAAQIRIDAMRLMNDVPELKEKIAEGKITVSVAAQVQGFLRRDLQSKEKSRPMFEKNSPSLSREEKLELIQNLEGKSSREVEKELVSRNPEAASSPDRVKLVTPEKFEMKISISKEVFERLEQVKALLSHKNSGEWESVLSEMAEITIRKLEPSEKKTPSKGELSKKRDLEVKSREDHLPNENSKKIKLPNAPDLSRDRDVQVETKYQKTERTADRRTRHIRKSVKAQVWERDEACCAYIDPQTRRRCGSKHFLQYDHVQSFSLGGDNTAQNLRLLCGAHNRLRNERSYSTQAP